MMNFFRRIFGKPRTGKQLLGEAGERLAAKILRAEGMTILERNLRAGAHDEIDIVALDCRRLVFVEVKTRSSDEKSAPKDAVNRAKQARIRRAAKLIIAAEKSHLPPRYDVVEIVGDPRHAPQLCKVNHIKGAFH